MRKSFDNELFRVSFVKQMRDNKQKRQPPVPTDGEDANCQHGQDTKSPKTED